MTLQEIYEAVQSCSIDDYVKVKLKPTHADIILERKTTVFGELTSKEDNSIVVKTLTGDRLIDLTMIESIYKI